MRHHIESRVYLVGEHPLAKTVFFNAAAADLAPHSLPVYFIDFESIQFALPIWKGTRPYQQIVFQPAHLGTGRQTHRYPLRLNWHLPGLSLKFFA